ncbi:hypothetical protein MN116_001438 [Schistosoma mekongi]|uniref:Uncharacterized protein n=1 Tax=Schistosoma mekongi TaxID=38744 RepID=A0AAE2DAG2_SCHME|nr:hypothetical protein MN116_001438 [Schistosoma mekongi]
MLIFSLISTTLKKDGLLKQELDAKLHSLDRSSTAYKNLQSFDSSINIKKGINFQTLKDQMDILVTLKEQDFNALELATEEDKSVHEELVANIEILTTRLNSRRNIPKEKQTMYCRRWYNQKLGKIRWSSSHAIFKFNTDRIQKAQDPSSIPLLRGLLKRRMFGTLSLTDIRAISCHDNIVSLSQRLTSALTPSTIVASLQLQELVDLTLIEDIKRLSSMYPLDWDPATRNLHLLAGQEGIATATVHIAPNGSISLMKIRNASNPDQPKPYFTESCNFVPPISWSLDEWLMEINDFCNSAMPTG